MWVLRGLPFGAAPWTTSSIAPKLTFTHLALQV